MKGNEEKSHLKRDVDYVLDDFRIGSLSGNSEDLCNFKPDASWHAFLLPNSTMTRVNLTDGTFRFVSLAKHSFPNRFDAVRIENNRYRDIIGT